MKVNGNYVVTPSSTRCVGNIFMSDTLELAADISSFNAFCCSRWSTQEIHIAWLVKESAKKPTMRAPTLTFLSVVHLRAHTTPSRHCLLCQHPWLSNSRAGQFSYRQLGLYLSSSRLCSVSKLRSVMLNCSGCRASTQLRSPSIFEKCMRVEVACISSCCTRAVLDTQPCINVWTLACICRKDCWTSP
jgi:hypothetical protein